MAEVGMNFENKRSPERKGLTLEQFSRVQDVALRKVRERGSEYFAWVNPPKLEDGKLLHTTGWGESAETREISVEEALQIYERKLNGAYAERFMTTLGMIPSLIENEYSVRLVQFAKEEGTPFDASGWIVMIIETMPMFHISPDDLDARDIADLVEVLTDNQDPSVSWKGTNKVGEFHAILMATREAGLDLVEIAKRYSNRD